MERNTSPNGLALVNPNSSGKKGAYDLVELAANIWQLHPQAAKHQRAARPQEGSRGEEELEDAREGRAARAEAGGEGEDSDLDLLSSWQPPPPNPTPTHTFFYTAGTLYRG